MKQMLLPSTSEIVSAVCVPFRCIHFFPSDPENAFPFFLENPLLLLNRLSESGPLPPPPHFFIFQPFTNHCCPCWFFQFFSRWRGCALFFLSPPFHSRLAPSLGNFPPCLFPLPHPFSSELLFSPPPDPSTWARSAFDPLLFYAFMS